MAFLDKNHPACLEIPFAAASPVQTDAEVDEADTALVIYSSGTTGRPKGALLSQRALVNHAANLAPAESDMHCSASAPECRQSSPANPMPPA